MAFKLTVTRETEPARADEFIFNQDRITIGRDVACDLTLPDPQRLVSKQHALVERIGDSFRLVDLGSKNQTILNARRLVAQQPALLQNGDRIEIGDFTLEFQHVAPTPPSFDLDKTVFGSNFVNPFNEDARLLAEALNRVSRTYADEPQGRREDALREAIEDALFGLERGEPVRLLAGMLAPGQDAMLAPPHPPAPPPYAPPDEGTSYAPAGWEALPPPSASPGFGVPPAATDWPSAPDVRYGAASPQQEGPMVQVVDLLLESVVQLVKALWQFRLEFLGQTVVETPGTFALHTSSAEEAKRYLLDPNIPQDERNRRLLQVERAVHEVLAHQIGVLQGYKAGVQEGVEHIMEALDPNRQDAEPSGKRSPLDFLFKGKEEAFDRVVRKHHEMQAEHHGSFEKRFFRPAFIRTYLKTISTARDVS